MKIIYDEFNQLVELFTNPDELIELANKLREHMADPENEGRPASTEIEQNSRFSLWIRSDR